MSKVDNLLQQLKQNHNLQPLIIKELEQEENNINNKQLTILQRTIINNKQPILEEEHWFNSNINRAILTTHNLTQATTLTTHQTVSLLTSTLRKYQLTHYYQHIINTNHSNWNWSSFINNLIAIPTKLSAFIHQHDQTHHELETNHFLTNISIQFHALIEFIATTSDPTLHIKNIQYLLTKLINIGFISLDINTIQLDQPHDLISAIWSQLITAPLTNSNQPLSRLWQSTISSLPRTELKSFIASFLLHLQYHLPLQPLPFSTDPHASAVEQAGAEILKFYLGDWGSENNLGTTDLFELITEILTTTEGWTIATARFIARWSSLTIHLDSTLNARTFLAKSTLNAFASQNQIARGTVSHHSFLLVLLLLTACPIQQSKTAQSPANICLDPVFINAIQRSLSSLRPQFRLLGMLMAELLTEFHRLPGATKLDFGHNFDKTDDEENRMCVAIRELSHRWKTSHHIPDHLWRDLLSSMAADHRKKVAAPQLNPRSHPAHDTLIDTGPLTDPNQLTLTELRLAPKEAPIPSRNGKPKIEVLDSIPADPELEAYEISEEDLGSLYPPSRRHEDDDEDRATTLEPEFDYSQMKDQVHKPVFLAQLSEYLKDSENFDRVRVGLMEAETLIRRKRNWGTELQEHALDLTHTMLNLQDNFALEGFERYRQATLVALIVSAPMSVGPCVIEQIFYHQYSIAQRLGMLNSLVRAVLELADVGPPPPPRTNEERFKRIKSHPIHQLLVDYQSQDSDLTTLAHPESVSPSLQSLERQPQPQWISRRLASQRKGYPADHDDDIRRDRDDGHEYGLIQVTTSTLQVEERFLQIMVNRLSWYLEEFTRSSCCGSIGKGVFSGAGWMILWEPLLVQKLVSTLKLLTFLKISRASSTRTTGGREGISDGKTRELVKEVACVLVKMLVFLRAAAADKPETGEEEEDVNRPLNMAAIIELLVQILSVLHVLPHPSSFSSVPNRPAMVALVGPETHDALVVGHSASQTQLDSLFLQLLQLSSSSAAASTGSYSLPLDRPGLADRFLTIVAQILESV